MRPAVHRCTFAAAQLSNLREEVAADNTTSLSTVETLIL